MTEIQKKYSKLSLKKILGLILMIITLIIIITAPDIKLLYSKCPCTKIKNRNIRNFVMKDINRKKLLDSCLSPLDSFEYYNNLYKSTIKAICDLEDGKYITKQDKNKLFNLLKRGNILSLKQDLKTISLNIVDSESLSTKLFLDGLVNELLFLDKQAEKSYILAIENNKFVGKYYIQLAKLYNKNCKYKDSINSLLKVSSILNNNNDRTNIEDVYMFLGDLYFKTRDYENALVYYSNNLITIDAKNKNTEKHNVVTKLGHIMMIRGNYFEAINYYKYALSLKSKKMSKDAEVRLLLNLSQAYYKYGNYINGLKFAKSASQKSRQIRDKLLHSKAKYNECLNYEYLNDSNKAQRSCSMALKDGYQYITENKTDIDGYINIGEMLDYSTYVRNPKLAKTHFEKALGMVGKDVLQEMSILEQIMLIDAYSSSFTNVPQQYKYLKNLYKKHDIESGCCNVVLNAFVKERMGSRDAERDYLMAEMDLKNNYSQLATLYSYLADYYKNNGMLKKALIYAKKFYELNTQIYRYDHHYVKYSLEQVESITKLIEQKDSAKKQIKNVKK